MPPLQRPGLEELRLRALASQKFREWRPVGLTNPLNYTGDTFVDVGGSWHNGPEPKPKPVPDHPITEIHFTPLQLGNAWGLSDDTIREIFKDEPGVLCIGTNGSRRRRKYITMRIPESVAVRVHTRLCARARPREKLSLYEPGREAVSMQHLVRLACWWEADSQAAWLERLAASAATSPRYGIRRT